MPSPQITVSVYMPRSRNDFRMLSTEAIWAAIRLQMPMGENLKYREGNIRLSFLKKALEQYEIFTYNNPKTRVQSRFNH